MQYLLSSLALIVLGSTVAVAEESRGLGAHEHGSGTLNIAIEDDSIAMELEAPGADIVGFEYAARSATDRATVDSAISDLARPLDLFVLPAAAGCTVIEARIALIGEDEHDHAEADHHDHEEDEHHAEDAHDEAEAEHTEFQAQYLMTCADPGAIDSIRFAYFERFQNALELEVQIVSDAGAQSFEVERDDGDLNLSGMF